MAPLRPLLDDKHAVEANLLKYFNFNPQVVQIGDILLPYLLKVVEGEFQEDTDFMQKVLDFTPSESEEVPG